MILTRHGNKKELADTIVGHFPAHLIFIELFFGAGGLFFKKPKARYNIVNDKDSEVYNLFSVVAYQKADLYRAFRGTPIHSDLLDYWKVHKETDPVLKALRFLFLSNFTYMGGGNTIKFGTENPKNKFYKNLDRTADLLHDVQFLNKCYTEVLSSIQIKDKTKAFIYADSPYLDTKGNYDQFKEADTQQLMEHLKSSGFRFAMSEFANPIVLEMAGDYGLNIISLGERQNLKDRQTEILITNYKTQLNLFQ